MKHLNIRVTGRVQGVFFRATAAEQARMLNLTGFVCNEPDGTVYIEAEGKDENLVRLVEWCWQGPPRASVSEVQVTESHLQDFSSFEITR